MGCENYHKESTNKVTQHLDQETNFCIFCSMAKKYIFFWIN